jgi:hypothetical protein
MKKKVIYITESQAVEHLKKYIDECDGDEIARLLGELFGGECFQNVKDTSLYDFQCDKYYSGEFDK